MSRILMIRGQDMTGAVKVALVLAAVAAMAAPNTDVQQYTLSLDASKFTPDNTGHFTLDLASLSTSEVARATSPPGLKAAADYEVVAVRVMDAQGKVLNKGHTQPPQRAVYTHSPGETVAAQPTVHNAHSSVPLPHSPGHPPGKGPRVATLAEIQAKQAQQAADKAAGDEAALAKAQQAETHGGATGDPGEEL